MKKLSKSDQSIEEQKTQQSADLITLHKLMTQPHIGTEPGDSCTIILWPGGTFSDGGKIKGTYTEDGWTI